MSTNVTTLSGNVGAEPKFVTTPNGTLICEFSLASNQYKLDHNAEKQVQTSWIPIKVFNKLAERVQRQVTKGTRLIVTGRLQEENWVDKQTNQKRSRLLVIAESLELIGGAKVAAEKADSNVSHIPVAKAVGQAYNPDIPF